MGTRTVTITLRPKQIGDDTGQNGDHCVARVAPEPVYVGHAASPGQVGDVSYQRREGQGTQEQCQVP
jgi:hypothetical protein